MEFEVSVMKSKKRKKVNVISSKLFIER